MEPSRETFRGKPIRVQVSEGRLVGELAVPRLARGVVLFAQGGGSRHNPRFGILARALGDAQIASVTLDLLTEDEAHIDRVTSHLRFDIDLLAERLVSAAEFLAKHRQTSALRFGLLATNTGSGAAMIAAAERADLINAVVSYGGRPDLALGALDEVEVPALFIVGSKDTQIADLNRSALERLRGVKRLETIQGATHEFQEPGSLERVAQIATQWFTRYLGRRNPLEERRSPES